MKTRFTIKNIECDVLKAELLEIEVESTEAEYLGMLKNMSELFGPVLTEFIKNNTTATH